MAKESGKLSCFFYKYSPQSRRPFKIYGISTTSPISKGLRKDSLFLQPLTGDKFSPIIPVVLKSFQFCKDVPTGFTGGYSTNTRRKTA